MTIACPQRAHRRVGCAVEVLHLIGSVPGRAPGEAHADERLGIDPAAELDELFKSWPGRLQASPGAEGLAAIGIADRVLPFEVAEIGIVQGAAPEANDARLQVEQGRD